MKAFLLAAGYGTRLKPFTDTVPKCMMPICGKPLLSWWMELFEKHSVTEVLVNTHYLPDAVREFVQIYNAKNTGVRLIEAYEKNCWEAAVRYWQIKVLLKVKAIF